MKIILADIEKAVTEAYERFCGELEIVEIHKGNILKVKCDAIVSPANSYGFMDGGIDMVYSQYFGWGLQKRLQQKIQSKYYGELLVGQAEIIQTEKHNIPFLIAAPTMRVPMTLGNTVNIYLAVRAVFLLLKYGIFDNDSGDLAGKPISDVVQRVAFPGLGTGVGSVGPNTCAKQMRSAIDDFVLDKFSFPFSWVDAQENHQKLYRSFVRDLQHNE